MHGCGFCCLAGHLELVCGDVFYSAFRTFYSAFRDLRVVITGVIGGAAGLVLVKAEAEVAGIS